MTSDQSSASPGFPARVPFFYGWVMVGVGFIGFLASGAGQSFTVSTFVGLITVEFGLSRTSFFGAYGLGTLTAAAALVYVGRLIDRIGPRLMLAGVGFLLGFSAMLFSLVGGLATLFVGFTALRLFGQGSMMLCSTNLTSQWFIRRRGLALPAALLLVRDRPRGGGAAARWRPSRGAGRTAGRRARNGRDP